MYSYNVSRVSPGIFRDRKGGLVTQNTLNNMNTQYNQWANQLPTLKRGSEQYNTVAGQIRNAGDLYGYDYSKLFSAGNPAQNPQRVDAIRQYNDSINRIKKLNLQPGTDQYTRNAQRIKDIGSKYGFNWQRHIGKDFGAQPAQAQAQAQAPAPTEPSPEQMMSGYRSPMTDALMKAFSQGTSTMNAYLPQNYEGSPMYQFQKEQGQKDLSKLMAARGLTNSGAEIEANSKFLNELGATESEKARQYAENEAQRAQNAMQFIAQYDQSERENLLRQLNANVDRRNALSQFEANRQDAARNLGVNTLLEVLGLQSKNNVADMAYKGMNQQSAYAEALAKALSSFTAQNYARRSGGGSLPPPPPYNRSALDINQILANYSNNADQSSIWNTLLRF